jgi:hypothetical protein
MYGIYNPIVKRNMRLQFEAEHKPTVEEIDKGKEKETGAEMIIRLAGFDVTKCPKCKEVRMCVLESLAQIRSPDSHLPSIILSLFKYNHRLKSLKIERGGENYPH